ncbi:MAG: hypothetical protein ABI274_04170, partial [Ktedonobacterales bacterium]
MWLRLLTIALGIWLMVSPDVLPSTPEIAILARIAGPVAIFIGVLALRTVTRPFRVVNILTGIFLLIVPWLVPATGPMLWNTELAGWLLIILTLPQGRRGQLVGGGWLAL